MQSYPRRREIDFTKFDVPPDQLEARYGLPREVRFCREEQLRELCDRHRKTDGSYDCLVPGSGGKDSFYAAHLLKYTYGEFPERFAQEIFDYLSLPEAQFPEASRRFAQPIMDRDYFLNLAESFRSPHLWMRENGGWKLRHNVWDSSPGSA